MDILEPVLRRSGCDGDLCTEEWHEAVRRAISVAEDTSPEPPGSVAGDEYEVAARDWYRKLGGSDELPTTKGLAAHFRAACGKREAELETKLLALCDEWDDNQTYVMPTNTRGGWDKAAMKMLTYMRNAQRKISCTAITDARAKQGKETRT